MMKIYNVYASKMIKKMYYIIVWSLKFDILQDKTPPNKRT